MKPNKEIPGQKLSSGFFNTIYLSPDQSTVIKIPKLTTRLIGETKEKLSWALDIHKTFLGDAIPEMHIRDSKLSPLGYIIEQAYCPGIELHSSDLSGPIKKEWLNLISKGLALEKEKGLFFDMYGRNGVLHALPQACNKTYSLLFTNIILTPEKRLKYIDISRLSTNNLLVQCAKVCRDYLNEHSLKV